MGILATLIGLPVTFFAIAIGIVFIFVGGYISRKINRIILKQIIHFLFCLPICVVIALYLGGIVTSTIYWYSKGVEGILNKLLIPIISMIIGTLNLLEPGHIMMGDNGPMISTEIATKIIFSISIIVNVILVHRSHNKN